MVEKHDNVGGRTVAAPDINGTFSAPFPLRGTQKRSPR